MGALAGQIADPGQYNVDITKTIARGKRTTPSSTTTTAATVLRLDGVPVKAGHLYRVRSSPLHLDSSVNGDATQGFITYTTDGSTAGTGSTTLAIAQVDQPDAAIQLPVTFDNSYVPVADQVLSICLCVFRAAGSGNVSIYGDTTLPIEIYVDDCGVDPGDIGVDL